MAFTWHSKIKKTGKKAHLKPTNTEEHVAQMLFDLQANSKELKADLASIYICAAREVKKDGEKSALVVFFPFRLLTDVRKIQNHLVEELEKKSGKHVILLAQRRILQKEATTGNKKKVQKRPRSRTLTTVHESILNDLVFPAEVSGKRIRVRVDGTRTIKVTLEAKESVEHKLNTYANVYTQLTGKKIVFFQPNDKVEAQ